MRGSAFVLILLLPLLFLLPGEEGSSGQHKEQQPTVMYFRGNTAPVVLNDEDTYQILCKIKSNIEIIKNEIGYEYDNEKN